MKLKKMIRINHNILLNIFQKFYLLNRKNIEDYYNLKYEIAKNKILINKLSTSIFFLLNPNIINLKRKIIELILS